MAAQNLTADVVTAKSFVLIDDENRERASISSVPSGDNGAVVVQLSDHVGRPRITLQVDDDGNTSIGLFTESNAAAVSLAIDRDRGCGIVVGDASGVPCVQIGVPNVGSEEFLDGAPHVIVSDHDGHPLWSSVAE